MSDKKKKKVYRVTMTADMDENVVKVGYGRSVALMKQADRQMFLNITLAGTDTSLKKLIGGLPMLRPATDEEREANIYVMVNGKEDDDLYRGRSELYHTIANLFQNTLHELFPDVEYKEKCTEYQQELIFDMTKEEAEEYQKEIEALTESVIQKVKEGEQDGNGDEGTTSGTRSEVQ